MKYEIYIDGSCPQNPGPYGSYAGIILNKKEAPVRIFVGQVNESTTSNRMELLGLLTALNYCSDNHEYVIYCDSKYTVNIFNHWIYGWIRKRKPMLNIDIWKQFIPFLTHKNIKVTWVRGHNGNKWNEIADQLCSMTRQYPGLTSYMSNDERFDLEVDAILNKGTRGPFCLCNAS